MCIRDSISDCGRIVAERKQAEGWFDISTLKEPFRVEGKKTMGYELVEQLGWEYPDAVFYPTGGGVGMIGMWKAFEEMEQLGWVTGKRPKMIAIQAAGCAPVARAFDQGEAVSRVWQNAHTFASGLRVPKPYGDSIILEIVRASGGTALALTDDEIFASVKDWAAHEGLLLSPEGAAATAAYDHLLGTGFLTAQDRVVLFNTGSGNKYTDVLAAKFRAVSYTHLDVYKRQLHCFDEISTRRQQVHIRKLALVILDDLQKMLVVAALYWPFNNQTAVVALSLIHI